MKFKFNFLYNVMCGSKKKIGLSRLKIIFTAVLFFGIFGLAKNSLAATYYVCDTISACNSNGGSGWGSPSDSTGTGSKSSPWKSIGYAVQQIQSNDTVIMGNGTYTCSTGNNANCIDIYQKYNHIPSGSGGSPRQFTTIQAEFDGGAIVDGSGYNASAWRIIGDCSQNTEPGLNIGDCTNNPAEYGGPIYQRYIHIRGIHFKNTGLEVESADHVWMNRNIFEGSGSDEGTGPSFGLDTFLLFEDNITYGNGRTRLLFWHVHFSIARNNIARNDYCSISDNPISIFDNYSGIYNEWQNNIAVDMPSSATEFSADQYAGALCNAATTNVLCDEFNSNSTNSAPDSNCAYNGIVNWNNDIIVNTHMNWAEIDDNSGGFDPHSNFNNCIGWDMHTDQPNTNIAAGMSSPTIIQQGNTTFNHITLGNVSKGTYGSEDNTNFSTWAHHGAPYPSGNLNNSIFTNFGGTDYMFSSSYTNTAVDHLDVYNFNGQMRNGNDATAITNPLSMNPIWNVSSNTSGGLKWLPEIEGVTFGSSSNLSSAGASGTYLGANVLYQYGKSGTFFGDPGYNELQDGTHDPNSGNVVVRMWPLPDEDIARAMCSYSDHGVTGNRGWCTYSCKQSAYAASPLSCYIWEYLGNQMPANIYATSSDTTAPAAPGGLSVW